MKRPLVSIIVTTLNNHKTLEACLHSIDTQNYKLIELVVVDNSSIDDTIAIAKRHTVGIYTKGPERSAQRNYGVKKSKGDFVLIIDSDMELGKDVVKACVDNIQRSPDTRALIIPEESFGTGFWAKCKRLERSFYVGAEDIEAARFFDKSIYQQVGGYDEAMISGEDWDLSQRVALETKIGHINEFIFHNENKLKLSATLYKKYHYANLSDVYLQKHYVRSKLNSPVGPVQRYKLFFSHPSRLLRNPIIGIGMLYMKTCEFGFGAIGFISARVWGVKNVNK